MDESDPHPHANACAHSDSHAQAHAERVSDPDGFPDAGGQAVMKPRGAGALPAHVAALRAGGTAPRMWPPAVAAGPVLSKVILVGQAPGRHEPVLGRPFAWTAGRAMFSWFGQHCGVPEERFRQTVYMAAVCRCFPGNKPGGGDRVPDPGEIAACSRWLRAEFALLSPQLVIPVGKLAIAQFLPPAPLVDQIGRAFRGEYAGRSFDVIPLPHPSGASPWPRMSPGRELLAEAMALIRAHPAFPK